MRVVPFPGGGSAGREAAWLAELEAALGDDTQGAGTGSWRELRDDVRTLAPPIDPQFEQHLRERLTEPPARAPVGARPRRRMPRAPKAWRPALAALAVACALAGVVVTVAPWRTADHPVPSAVSSAGVARGSNAGRARADEKSAAVAGAAQAAAPSAGGPISTPGRVQQLAASISLTTAPTNVQAVADGVARLATREQGFVQSSNVQVQRVGQSEATLTLRIPSARLDAALASLAQLAPVSAERQSLQDITGTYDAARQRLADAEAERGALLRALAGASSEAKVDALRYQLAQVRVTIAQARSGLRSVSQRANDAEVEVTVLGSAHTASEGLTLHRGLHDAGRVLTVALVVAIVAAAVLVPLSLVLLLLAGAGRMWSRRRRERVLDQA